MVSASQVALWGSRRWQRLATAALAVVVCWPSVDTFAPVGLDPSWKAGLSLAHSGSLRWGDDVVFTFGPFSYLSQPEYYTRGQAVATTVFLALTSALLFLGVTAAVRLRGAPWVGLVSGFVALVATALWIPGAVEVATFAAFAWAAVAVLPDDNDRASTNRIVFAAASAAAFLLLVKFNVGASVLAIALAASVLTDWRAWRRHAGLIGCFLGSLVVFWLASGQRLGDFVDWIRLSVQIAAGYTDAMTAAFLPSSGVWAVAVVVAAWTIGLIVAATGRLPDVPPRFAALAGLLSAIMVKSALARFDFAHVGVLLVTIVVVLTVTPFARGVRRVAIPAFAVGIIFITMWFPGLRPLTDSGRDAVRGTKMAASRLWTLSSSERTAEAIAGSRAGQQFAYQVPASMIEEIGDNAVHIDPEEASIAWAHQMTWKPTPVFQSYAAYTPTLDALNADALIGDPRLVLSFVPPMSPAVNIDGRLTVQQAPLTTRALLCHYRPTQREPHWALFAPTEPRCGPLEPIGERTVRAGQSIDVPQPSRPDAVVLVAIDTDVPLIDRALQRAIIPLRLPEVVLDGTGYRLVMANASEPFLVRSGPSTEGTSLAIDADTVAVTKAGDTVTLSFYEMTVGP